MDQNHNPQENPQNNLNHNPYSYKPYPNPGYGNHRQMNPMETVALVLAILSIVTCTCCYLSLPMGSMAVVLALLSRGGQMKLGTKAKIAIIVGIGGIILTVGMFAVSFLVALREYGSIEGILREGCEMMGLDFEAMYGDMFQ
jgi:hypothetical protein